MPTPTCKRSIWAASYECDLEIDDVHTYYEHSHILQGITLQAQAGAVTGILGRNGVGKTTLMRSIIGFTPPRRGSIRFAGERIERLPSHYIARRGIGLVPQGRRVFPSLSVLENLQIGAASTRSGPLESRYGFRAFPATKTAARTTAASSVAASSKCSRSVAR